MLNVHRQQHDPFFFHFLHDQLAARYESLFISKGNIMSCLDCMREANQAANAHQS